VLSHLSAICADGVCRSAVIAAAVKRAAAAIVGSTQPMVFIISLVNAASQMQHSVLLVRTGSVGGPPIVGGTCIFNACCVQRNPDGDSAVAPSACSDAAVSRLCDQQCCEIMCPLRCLPSRTIQQLHTLSCRAPSCSLQPGAASLAQPSAGSPSWRASFWGWLMWTAPFGAAG
jgi:hypothetical protein